MRRVAGVIAVVAATALVTQLALNFGKAPLKAIPYWRVPIDFLGYFTIWSNILVALVCWAVTRGKSGLLTRPGTLAATLVYITVVAVIYNTLLIQLNPVVGLGKVIDRTLHIVVPVSFVLWWLLLVPRQKLTWQDLAPALVFPSAYSVVALTKGSITGKYAYFFIDIGKYGLPQVLLNLVGLVLFFALLMALVIAFDRRGRPAVAARIAVE